MAAAKKKSGKGLGRGLDALLGDVPRARKAPKETGQELDQNNDGSAEKGAPRQRQTLPITSLIANPDQPRRIFNDDAIAELSESIKTRGLLQPVLVRPRADGDYEIVAGERRWRAAQKAQLHDIPVLIRELTDEEAAEIALIENVQRVDLNPIEEAEAYQRLSEVYGRKQAEIAKAVGKSRSHVTNMMRLMDLPKASRAAAVAGEITMGHARALLAAPDPDKTCLLVIREGLSVRETEALVKAEAGSATGGGSSKNKKPFLEDKKPAKGGQKKDADTRALEADLGATLGLEVEIEHSKKGAGAVTIKYLDLDQLDDVCRRLMGSGV